MTSATSERRTTAFYYSKRSDSGRKVFLGRRSCDSRLPPVPLCGFLAGLLRQRLGSKDHSDHSGYKCEHGTPIEDRFPTPTRSFHKPCPHVGADCSRHALCGVQEAVVGRGVFTSKVVAQRRWEEGVDLPPCEEDANERNGE